LKNFDGISGILGEGLDGINKIYRIRGRILDMRDMNYRK
jgi:hypothetical protein